MGASTWQRACDEREGISRLIPASVFKTKSWLAGCVASQRPAVVIIIAIISGSSSSSAIIIIIISRSRGRTQPATHPRHLV
jgi:hypothetical protein